MEYEKKLERAVEHAEKVKLNQELSDVWHSNDKPKEKLSFSKAAFIFMMANCVVIEIYALVVMAIYGDLSSLSTLIAAVIGECVSLLGYLIKSKHENTSGGIVYETTMAKLNHELELGNYENNDESVG